MGRWADKMGVPGPEGALIPMALSRQDLADLTGTTVETCIRIMSPGFSTLFDAHERRRSPDPS